MSPMRACPECGVPTAFHEDELEGVEGGSAVCPTCGLRAAENAFFFEIIEGRHDQLIPELSEEADGG